MTPSPELQRRWHVWLLATWRDINKKHLENELEPPTFEFSAATSRLGAWIAQTRTIEIQTRHLLTDPWPEVELTLRHEMAHQVVSELWDGDGSPTHGALFERACQLLSLDESARFERTLDPEQVRILKRVEKLMRLGDSPNQYEAELALSKAHQLLLEHNLQSLGAETAAQYRFLGQPLGRIPLELKLITAVLSEHFFVDPIWIATIDSQTGNPRRLLEIVGRPHNLEIAAHVHDYLIQVLDTAWSEYRNSSPDVAGNSARNSFRVGILMGFLEHLGAQRKERESTGLVWTGDPAAKELFERRHPRRTSGGAATYRVGEHHEAGLERGRALRIRAGIGEAGPASRGHLLKS
ncbi:MAG: DUF2786 domain-containing protein [Myxococcales bacterium]|nr:DUF2786 domain-containing protein [Myxococcales bacterium]